ncbi:MAG: hypothetical protein ACO1QS_01410 [Verrucomicrobiota bacterium]
MRTLYCKSEASFLDLLEPMFAELNSLYWLVDCQMGPVKTEWIFENPSREQSFEDMHIPVPAFKNRGTQLWRPGSLSLVRDALYFDEWSYFTGFKANEAQAVDRATRLGRAKHFSPEFYDLLTQEGFLFALHVDGWWEFSPANDELFHRIKACTGSREIMLRKPNDLDWSPKYI